MLKILLSLFVVTILIMDSNTQTEKAATTRKPTTTTDLPCGQYGFRCVDTRSFQVCAYRDSDGQTELPETVHECHDNTICDEDNPAYCSPVDDMFTTIKSADSNCLREKEIDDEYSEREARDTNDENYYNLFDNFAKYDDTVAINEEEYEDYDHNMYNRQIELNNEEENITTTTNEPEMTTINATESCVSFTDQPPHDCEAFGFFPDHSNNTLFWFCDVGKDGVGFRVRHMRCGKERVFDSVKKECILCGTTRNTRNNYNNRKESSLSERIVKKLSEHLFLEEPPLLPIIEEINFSKNIYKILQQSINKRPPVSIEPKSKFSCCGKPTGKYADPNNCRAYHFCLVPAFAPFQDIIMTCPAGTAYDPISQNCCRMALFRCQPNISKLPKPIKCNPSIRLYDPNTCDAYYLCFDDKMLHMQCPQYYKFNDELLECLPQQYVKCRHIEELP